jgi:hypothetical protein
VIAQRARSWWAGEGRLAGADGVQLALDGELVRHAEWAAPSPLAAPLAGNANLGRPAISPDGRWLAFAAGERGQDVGLYLCERHGDALGAARRLAGLDSPADELAPAFGAGYLYFASDRAGGAGGLDLWRAPFADGATGEPEHLGGALASAADDTDPAPCARAGELVFASNRGGDFDLYLGLAAEGVLHIEELASRPTSASRSSPARSRCWPSPPIDARAAISTCGAACARSARSSAASPGPQRGRSRA